jgi:hypothetical protein
VATDLAARLGADVAELRERTSRRGFLGHLRAALDSLRERPAVLGDVGKRAADYDLTIVGTPIWTGRITPAIRTYLTTIRGQCRNVAFFITSGATDVARVLPTMERLADSPAIASMGLTERDLRDEAVYRGKVNTFVESLSTAPQACHRRMSPRPQLHAV